MRFALLRVAVLSLLLLPFVGSLVRASVIGPSSKHHDFAAISPREVTAAQLQAARDVVAEAQRAIAADKKARMEDLKVRGTNRGFGPLVEVDATVTAAARLLGDVEALRMKMRRSRNGEGDGAEQEQDEAVAKRQATTRSFWMEGLKHNGTMAFNPDPTRYVVWRNVKDFGAKGDGITVSSFAEEGDQGTDCGVNLHMARMTRTRSTGPFRMETGALDRPASRAP